jgi:hypothetical protein
MYGLSRDTIDKFYTSPAVVSQCLARFTEEVKISPEDLLLEPSAGDGAFIAGLKALGAETRFYDLQPEHPEVCQQNYLELDTSLFSKKVSGKVHVVGNPPFGRQSSLAIKFIRKSAEFAATISFILPKSFKKPSFQAKVPLCFHLLAELDLPKDSFLLSSKPHDVPCVFQIWERRDTPRDKEVKEEPQGYEFVKKEENPDLCIRRVGFYTGKVDTEIDSKSVQSHYFIRFTDRDDIDGKVKRLENLEFGGKDNTVGARSISKGEVIKEFNTKLIR